MNRKAKDKESVQVIEVKQGVVNAYVLGTTPLILNRMSEKVKRELLMPRGKKNAAEKASSLKHDPIAEFQASAHRSPDPKAPTLLLHRADAFKGALRSAAIDMPGANKAQIGRLTYVEGEYISIYGIPKLFMSVTRSADFNRTPDVRTRVIIPHWAAMLSIKYVRPLLNDQTVINLLAASGIYCGTGDWRPEKGAGNYGQFKIVSADDDDLAHLFKTAGRKAQEQAMAAAAPYDAETAELLEWYHAEIKRRGREGDTQAGRASGKAEAPGAGVPLKRKPGRPKGNGEARPS